MWTIDTVTGERKNPRMGFIIVVGSALLFWGAVGLIIWRHWN